MSRPELHTTLSALITALDGPAAVYMPQVTEAELTVPFEMVIARYADGLRAFGAPPQSRFESGVMQPVHKVYVRVVREPVE